MWIKPFNPKGSQPWIFIGSVDTEADTPILWPLDVKNQFIRKDPDAGKHWGLQEKGVTEDEMVGLHDWLNGHEFMQIQEIVKDSEAWWATFHGSEVSGTT